MNLHIKILLLFGTSVSAAFAEEHVPKPFKPLAPMLGDWMGDVETKLTQQGEVRTLTNRKTTTCRIGDDGKSLVMEDTEINPWTEKEAVTSSVIRYDGLTEKYKAMVWDTEGAVRLFVVESAGRDIVFKQVDCPDGSTCSSTVTINRDGTLTEKGALLIGGLDPQRVEWTIRYTKTKVEQDAQE